MSRSVDRADAEWPFLDDDDRLRTVLKVISGKEASAVVISGQSGVGRTRVAQEAIRSLRASGRRTEWVTCTRGTAGMPLGALAHLVPVGGASSDPTAAWQAMATAFDAHGTERDPVIVCIDDAHLLDGLSATLALKLVLTRKAAVILTLLSGAQPPDVVDTLWKDRLAARVELRRWSRSQMDRLLTTVLGGAVDSRTGQFLWDTCQGRVDFLHELVRAGRETGRLHPVEGVWRWDGNVLMTQRLADVLQAETSELTVAEHNAADLLAIGSSLELVDIMRLSSPEAVASLERRGMVSVEQASGRPVARLTQPLHALGLQDRMPQATAHRLRHELVRRSSVQRWIREDPLRYRELLLQPESPVVEPSVLVRVAQQANASADHHLAERLARAALNEGAGTAASIPLAEAVRWQGRHVESDLIISEAVPRSTSESGRLAVTRMLNMFYGLGAVEAAFDTSSRPGAGGDTAAVVSAVQSLLRFSAGRPQEAVELADSLGVRTSADPYVQLWACAARTNALAVIGRSDEALASAARGWDALDRCSEDVESSAARVSLAHGELLALELSGRVRKTRTRATELHQAAMVRTGSADDAVCALGLGSATLAAGQPTLAIRWLMEALIQLVESDPIGSLQLCRARLAQAYALAGDPESAQKAFAGAGSSTVHVFDPETFLAEAWMAAADHREDEAAAAALQAASSASSMGARGMEANALHAAVRLGRASEVAGRLRELSAEVSGRWVALFTTHAEAVADRSGELLDNVATEFESLGALAHAADAAAQAAEAHDSVGNRRHAAVSAARAAAIARMAGGISTPALDRLGSRSLTVRQREVATLAAEGMSNQSIARQLVLSVRTVETHLAQAYAKLGITTRAALKNVLGNDQAQ